MVMTYLHAKAQGHRSISSKDRVETNGWMDQTDGHMDGADYITFLSNAVGNQ